MFFKSNVLYHIGRAKRSVSEGGMARDNAIFENLKKNSFLIHVTENKLFNTIKIFFFLSFSKNNKIFMHYPLIGLPVSNRYFFLKYIRKVFIKIFLIAEKRNKFYIDVSDLPIEQAIDLEINVPLYFSEIEPYVFNNKAVYLFASYSMKNYVLKKYSLSETNAKIWINGGYDVDDQYVNTKICFDKNMVNYVYAGTLNKGRQIEFMIEIFSRIEDKNLILMGSDGEWINDLNLPKNITYLGSLEEKYAHYIVSLCDIGLIPYDSQRPYYNIAYPTKLSFYITAGVSFLSTNVQEVKNINSNYSIGYMEDISLWSDLIIKLSKQEISKNKIQINLIKHNFLWSNIININDIN